MTPWAVGAFVSVSSLAVTSCGVGNHNLGGQKAYQGPEANAPVESEEEVNLAPLALTGLGDRLCSLRFWIVKKEADGNFKRIGASQFGDPSPREGFGRGCLQFCLTAFDQMRAVNKKDGNEILIHSCSFSRASGAAQPAVTSPAPSATPTPAASPSPTTQATTPATASPSLPPGVIENQNRVEACKVVQAGQKVIFAEQRERAECVAECKARETSNPSHRCEWGDEVLRQHQQNVCTVRGDGGKLLFQNNVTRFHCRVECKARETTNPNRSCIWGGEDIKGLSTPWG